MRLTQAQKKQIRHCVMNQYAHLNGRNVRCHADGAVTVHVDAMPRTNEPGRIFVGWDVDFLR